MLRDTSPARIFARPTADDLWLGPTRESVLSHLLQPASTRVLLGPVSSGRTSLLRHLVHRTGDQTTHLQARGPQTRSGTVLRSLMQSTGLASEELGADEMRSLITVYVQERLARGQRVVIELDDADAFNAFAWAEIEYLLGLESAGTRPQLIMSLVHLDDASSPAAAYVRHQNAPALGVLDWLEPKEVASYLRWRLDRFGLAGINTPAATRLIATCTRGCFAAIDHICQMALLVLRKRRSDQINVNVIREARNILKQQIKSTSPSAGEPVDDGKIHARIFVSQDGQVIRETPIADRLLIGRSKLNDLCIENAYLSRHHAAIIRKDSGYYLSDLNSVNGITLNGELVQSIRIEDGDVFSIGPFRIKLRVTRPLPNRVTDDVVATRLADTSVMPAAGEPEPAHLKVIK